MWVPRDIPQNRAKSSVSNCPALLRSTDICFSHHWTVSTLCFLWSCEIRFIFGGSVKRFFWKRHSAHYFNSHVQLFLTSLFTIRQYVYIYTPLRPTLYPQPVYDSVFDFQRSLIDVHTRVNTIYDLWRISIGHNHKNVYVQLVLNPKNRNNLTLDGVELCSH